MKTLVLSIATMLCLGTVNAQFSQNFEGTQGSLTANCWTLSGLNITNDPSDVINGTGSIYSNPPTSGSTRDLITPALNITDAGFTVSFNYKLSSDINGNATRTIEVGLLNGAGNFTSLATIVMDKNSPSTVQNFNQVFALAATGVRKLVIKLGGATGDGNSRLLLDDISVNASPLYGTGTCNSAPIAVDDSYSGLIGSVITGNILANDNEPNGETMVPSIVATSSDGVILLGVNGNFVFTPNPGFIGSQASFTYRSNDNGFDPLYSNIATVTLTYFNNGALPVKLTSFNAMLNNNKVDLKWTTATEINVSHFIVERSIDGQNYMDAGIVFAAGNTTKATHYASTDNIAALQATVIYYRLRSMDVDGKNQVSETRIIRVGKQVTTAISVLTYPNPVSNELRITIPNNWQNKKATYEIVSIGGQVAKKVETGSSSQTETINVSNMAPGFYIVRVTCEGQTAQQKIVKQ